MAKEYKKFKLVYGAKNKDIKGSLSGIPAEDDKVIVTLNNYDAKLVYEKGADLKASLTGIPAAGDRVIGTRKELEGMEVGEDDHEPAGPAKEEEEVEEVPAKKVVPAKKPTPAKQVEAKEEPVKEN